MVTRGRTYSSAPDAGSQQSVVVGTGPTPVSPIRRPSPTHRSQVTRNRRVVSSQRNVTRSPTLIADFTFSISAPSRLRLVTRTRSRKARFFASMPQRLAVRIIGRRGWRRHPIDFTNPLVGLIRALQRAGGWSCLQAARLVVTQVIRSDGPGYNPYSFRACAVPSDECRKADLCRERVRGSCNMVQVGEKRRTMESRVLPIHPPGVFWKSGRYRLVVVPLFTGARRRDCEDLRSYGRKEDRNPGN